MAFSMSGGELGGTLAFLVVVYLAFLGNAARDFHTVLEDAVHYRITTFDAQNQIEQHAYEKGFSELATSILEKLRNELTPIAVKMGRRRSAAARVTNGNLATALKEIADDSTDLDRRRKLARFVELAVDKMSSQESETWHDMQAIFAQLETVEDLLVERDRIHVSALKVEPVMLAEAVEQAHALMVALIDRELTVQIDPEVRNAATVLADRSVLVHVLRNLMLCSAQAIRLHDGEPGLSRSPLSGGRIRLPGRSPIFAFGTTDAAYCLRR